MKFATLALTASMAHAAALRTNSHAIISDDLINDMFADDKEWWGDAPDQWDQEEAEAFAAAFNITEWDIVTAGAPQGNLGYTVGNTLVSGGDDLWDSEEADTFVNLRDDIEWGYTDGTKLGSGAPKKMNIEDAE